MRLGTLTGSAIAYVLLGLAMWPLPVVGMVHAEAAAVIAAASFFIAGWGAVGGFARGESVRAVARRHLVLLLVPLAMLTATLLWRPNCGYGVGLGIFALFVPPSVLLGIALADVLSAFRVTRQRLWLVGLGVLGIIVPTIVTLKLHPQLFVYNMIYGGVLGPIYDAELAIRPGLFAHRALALVWASGGILLARWGRGERRVMPGVLACAAVLASAYIWSTPLGFTQSEANLRQRLPGQMAVGAAVLHYAPDEVPLARIREIADEAEYRTGQIGRVLGVAPSEPVHVYLYPDAKTKAALIGSRETSVVPVWLGSPQVHMLADRADGDLGHELVHVIAREFASPFTGATWKIGLVEGLAVALEAPEGLPSPEQQAVVALTLAPEAGGLVDASGAIQGAMNPLGFWTGRAGAAYSTTGAFVGWLLDRHGAAPIREVYRGTSWGEAFGKPLAELSAEWEAHLKTVEVSPEAVAYTTWRFAQPSLFEVPCPHHVPRWRRYGRAGDEAWEVGDLVAAQAAYAAAAREPLADSTLALLLDVRVETVDMLLQPDYDVRPLASLVAADTADLPQVRLAYARALALSGAPLADSAYARAIRALPPYSVRSRALTDAESRLAPEALRALLVPRPDSLSTIRAAEGLAASGDEGAVFRALLQAEAGDVAGAWIVFHDAEPFASGEPALALIGARMAYTSGDLNAAGRLARLASEGFGARGLIAAKRVAEDMRARVRWKRQRGR